MLDDCQCFGLLEEDCSVLGTQAEKARSPNWVRVCHTTAALVCDDHKNIIKPRSHRARPCERGFILFYRQCNYHYQLAYSIHINCTYPHSSMY